jgi:serine/threonine protein kinase
MRSCHKQFPHSRKIHFIKEQRYIKPLIIQFPKPDIKEPLEKKIEGITEIELDFLKKCIHLDPQQRPEAKDLLNHPYFQSIPESLD